MNKKYIIYVILINYSINYIDQLLWNCLLLALLFIYCVAYYESNLKKKFI